jgi:hypothetical protein
MEKGAGGNSSMRLCNSPATMDPRMKKEQEQVAREV